MTRAAGRRAPHRRAASATEMALVLPVLMILIVGCIDFGRFSHVNITVTNAARTGAEFGSMNAYSVATADEWEEAVRQAVVDEMARTDRFDPARLSVTVTRATDDDHPRVEVDVSYPFETVVGWPGIPERLILRRVVAMPMTRL